MEKHAVAQREEIVVIKNIEPVRKILRARYEICGRLIEYAIRNLIKRFVSTDSVCVVKHSTLQIRQRTQETIDVASENVSPDPELSITCRS